ncbi:MAG: Wzz/FepE/Etk N-terminal domain-containing protein [Bacillota bacterium]
MEHQGEYADEIDLREYIEVLWRGKWIVAVITLSAMVLAGLISFFVLDPVYESSTVLAVSLPEEVRAGLGDPVIAGILGGTPQAHIRLLEDPMILRRAAQALGARGIHVDAKALGDKVTVRAIGDTSKGDKLIETTVKDKTPADAKIIADAVSAEYVTFLSGLVSARISSRAQELREELARREARLVEAAKKLSDLIASSGGVDLIKQEIDAKTALLANYKGENTRLNMEARAVAESLRVLETQLESVPERLSVTSSFSEGVIITSQLKPEAATFTTEEVNPAYTDLLTEVAQRKATLAELEERLKAGRDTIAALSGELEALGARLVEDTVKERSLREAFDAAQSSYLEASMQLQALEQRQADTIVRSVVDVVAPASTPTEPSGPRRFLNIVIAGMLGVMVSVFAVFLLHYWYGAQPKPGTPARAAGSR